jgi:hypothetical protein
MIELNPRRNSPTLKFLKSGCGHLLYILHYFKHRSFGLWKFDIVFFKKSLV